MSRTAPAEVAPITPSRARCGSGVAARRCERMSRTTEIENRWKWLTSASCQNCFGKLISLSPPR